MTLRSDHSLQNSPPEMTLDVGASGPSAEVLAEAAQQVADRYPGLYGHQRTGITFLLTRQRAILADDMGMGKSRQAIVALREAAPDGNLLIVCPDSVKLNWHLHTRPAGHSESNSPSRCAGSPDAWAAFSRSDFA